MSISLISELVFTKPKLTPMGNCNGHESQRLTVYREFGDKELYGRSIKKMLYSTVEHQALQI